MKSCLHNFEELIIKHKAIHVFSSDSSEKWNSSFFLMCVMIVNCLFLLLIHRGLSQPVGFSPSAIVLQKLLTVVCQPRPGLCQTESQRRWVCYFFLVGTGGGWFIQWPGGSVWKCLCMSFYDRSGYTFVLSWIGVKLHSSWSSTGRNLPEWIRQQQKGATGNREAQIINISGHGHRANTSSLHSC